MAFSSFRRLFNNTHNADVESDANEAGSPGPEAQYLAGVQFAQASGNAQDFSRAAECYQKAAEQNHILAQFHLALLYEQGQGVTRDDAMARLWLTRAARQGNAAAQYRLGVKQHLHCRTGSDGPAMEGRIEALKWAQLSAAQGCQGAERACEFMALGLTLEEVAEAAHRTAAFVAGAV